MWENIISCFGGRVTTGVIINLLHKDVDQFLRDAFRLFKINVNKILSNFSIIKVNAFFCGEFKKYKKCENPEDQ